jgi:1-acyl-sn-glycerol-3-phosphate acyltransferase
MNNAATAGALPRRGNQLSRAAARLALALSGWRIEGAPPDSPKLVAIYAPHRSNWDFALAMLLMFGLGVRVSWMAKHTLFRRPIGAVMRWLGGIPIDRTARHGVVEQMIHAFQTRRQLIVGLMPEGTRRQAGSPVTAWKTGFYHIARGANVPILPLSIDRAGKRLILGRPVMPTGNMDADLAQLQAFYSNPTAH